MSLNLQSVMSVLIHWKRLVDILCRDDGLEMFRKSIALRPNSLSSMLNFIVVDSSSTSIKNQIEVGEALSMESACICPESSGQITCVRLADIFDMLHGSTSIVVFVYG